jgi:hypothetical protein
MTGGFIYGPIASPRNLILFNISIFEYPNMILGPVSYLDCLIFCLLLTPQLIWLVGLFETTFCALTALPFLGKQSTNRLGIRNKPT